MDEVNNPQTGGKRRAVGWAIGLGVAIVLAGVFVLGVTLSNGSGGTAQAAMAVLTGSGGTQASAGGAPASTGAPGAPAAAGASAFAGSAANPGAAGPHVRARLHACLAAAKHLRATGHRAAAKAKLRACVRRLRRLRAALIGGARGRVARLVELARQAMHGQVTVATKNGPKTIAFERGTVQSVSGASIVVKAADGVTVTWQVGSDARVFMRGHRVDATALASGQRVAVIGLVTGGTDQARRVLIGDHGASRS
jgi:hypothetical protein